MNTEGQKVPRLWEDTPLQGGTVDHAIAKYRMHAAPRYEHLMQVALIVAVVAFLASSIALLIKQGL